MSRKRDAADAAITASVFVDLEIHPETQVLLKIGAWRAADERGFYRQGNIDPSEDLQALLYFIGDSRFIIGHNIEQHDWPYLCEKELAFSELSPCLIDTLVLNPLAFPANPYHRLVKDYKLQRESVNDPVEDCKQTAILFADQCATFRQQAELSAVFALLLLNSGAAYPALFNTLLAAPVTANIAKKRIDACLNENVVCTEARRLIIDEIRSNDAARQRAMAYALAWLNAAGANSVLPAWVRHQHPQLPDMLDRLRNHACCKPDCHYCNTHHNLEASLKQFFGYDQFRHFGKPCADCGENDNGSDPLQRRIVASVASATPTLAILPTGGGKSLCYQLPAMMMARNRGLLTIIISPLQSLMNDQVQQLQARGYPYVAALNSSLTMPERHRVLEGIGMGDIHLLYIAPEQLRNRSFIGAIESREIGQWIIDEAHCLSKWGHDFRPDYLYIGKFVASFSKRQQQRIPPVHAFTATARLDVIDEILDHLEQSLGSRLTLLSGGHHRSNLDYQVVYCPAQQKREQVLALLTDMQVEIGDGAVIIFCNRRKYAEEMSEFLANNGKNSDYFHAYRDPHSKRQAQQAFMDGQTQVMAATNAFGMGVDKDNVRLVIHAQIPDSLENYLQEAGRGGRDGEPAACILLFDEADVDKQFEMRRSQQIEFRDFVALFETIRKQCRTFTQRGKSKHSQSGGISENTIQASSGDILRLAHRTDNAFDAPGFGSEDWQYDTKVHTAIAWLEEAGLLERRENRTNVIEGSFKLTAIDLIRTRLNKQRISASDAERWLKVAHAIMQHDQSDTINADQLAEQTGMDAKAVFRAITGLQHAGVMDHDMSLVAWLKAHVAGDSRTMLAHFGALESSLFGLIRDAMQGDHESDFELNIVHACHLLREATGQADISPPLVLQCLSLWTRLDKLLRTTPIGRDMHKLKWKRDFEQTAEQIKQRQHCADVSIDHLYTQIPDGEKGHLRIPFKLGGLQEALERNLTTRHLQGLDERSEQALLALQQNNLIGLESGAAIFHSAMTLHIPKGAKRPGKRAFAPLQDHYKAQIRQIHMIREWALRMADGKQASARALLNDYFDLGEKSLLKRYFSHRSKQSLEIPASQKRLNDIVGSRALSDIQRQIVQQPADQNMLILAGPGSGKTRLIVHRIAWLVAIQRESPDSVLTLAFNRSTASELRRRLMHDDMLGKQAWRLQIHTYHSLAMHLLGELPPDDEADFQGWSDTLMQRAAMLLEGGQEATDTDENNEPDDLRQRLIAGFRFILVDEYQDINQAQYRFLSALAGRTLDNEGEQLTMFAVGDDDQNIYEWNGSGNQYIHQFAADYHARIDYMTENYRSNCHIIAASNRLIARHPDRLKTDYPIVAANPDRPGSVQLYQGSLASLHQQALALCHNLVGEQHIQPERIAILCRQHQDYLPLARLLRSAALPVCLVNSQAPYRWDRLREVHCMTRIMEGSGTLCAGDIRAAWLQLPEQIHLHQTVQPLWNWLASYAPSGQSGDLSSHIVRPKQEWRSELWELAKAESRKTGQGIWLGSMHSVKGLEFDSVIVFAGKQGNQAGFCEELRLRYVAMTRAERQLILMQEQGGWFDQLGLSAKILPFEAREQGDENDLFCCSMKDVHLDFGGQRSAPVNLSGLHQHDPIELSEKSGELRWRNMIIGKLSRSTLAYLARQQQQGWHIHDVRVHAIVRRFLGDISDPHYQSRCRQEKWEIVLPAIHLNRGGYH
jgi:ATP-dependent DNA helicase RecQ